MTGVERGGGAPMGPPWPVEVLADLHAGALDDTVAGQLWPRMQGDPAARAVLAALDATRADLSGLAALPPPRMPADFAARLDQALAQESRNRAQHAAQQPPHQQIAPAIPFPQRPQPAPQQQPGPLPGVPVQGGPMQGGPVQQGPGAGSVTSLADARKRRNRLAGWGAGVVVAAAAAAGIVFATLPATTTPGNSVAAPPPGSVGSAPTGGGTPLALTSGGLNAGLVTKVGTQSDYGPLADPQVRAQCLAANGVAAGSNPIGAEQVTLDGKPGVLMVLTTGQLAQYRLLVVGPTCTAGSPATLANSVVGGIPVPTPTK